MKIGYHEESQHWDEYKIKVSNSQAKIVVMKLARHFKLPIKQINFYGFRDSGQASSWGGIIRLGNTPSIGLICHEVNHFLCWKKFGIRDSDGKKAVRHGTKRWCKQMQIIINYANKKGFWNEEFKRRNAPKPIKPKPTPSEIRLMKIERFEAGINRHQTKIKRCKTLIKKNNRRISALKRFI